MATEKDTIILEGVLMKKVVSSFFGNTKWMPRYYVLTKKTFTQFLEKQNDTICNQQSLENSAEAKRLSWPVNSIEIAALMRDQSTLYMKIVFNDGNCFQLATPEPEAIKSWVTNIERQKSMEVRESIVKESVSRIIYDVENNWDEKHEPLDKNFAQEVVKKKFFCSTDELQLEKLDDKDVAASLKKSIGESADGHLDLACITPRGKNSNMSIMNEENLGSFMNISHAYTELQKENCETQDEMKRNTIHYEKLHKQIDEKEKVIGQLRNELADIESCNQVSEEKLDEIIQRENDLEEKEIELYQLASRTNVDFTITQFGEEDHPKIDTVIGDTKKLEQLHHSVAKLIETKEKLSKNEEEKYNTNKGNLKNQEKDLEEKRNLLNVRFIQLKGETEKIATAELNLERRSAEADKKAQALKIAKRNFEMRKAKSSSYAVKDFDQETCG